jgi:hypothetical protein
MRNGVVPHTTAQYEGNDFSHGVVLLDGVPRWKFRDRPSRTGPFVPEKDITAVIQALKRREAMLAPSPPPTRAFTRERVEQSRRRTQQDSIVHSDIQPPTLPLHSSQINGQRYRTSSSLGKRSACMEKRRSTKSQAAQTAGQTACQDQALHGSNSQALARESMLQRTILASPRYIRGSSVGSRLSWQGVNVNANDAQTPKEGALRLH